VKQQKLTIPGILPGLNELIAAAKETWGRNKHGQRVDAYSSLKKRWTVELGIFIRACRLQKMTPPVWFEFQWVERNKRRDPDNVAAGGRKLILDALQAFGVIENDGWGTVTFGWSDKFLVDPKDPGVRVIMVDECNEEHADLFREWGFSTAEEDWG
jgi:hypothetical protein